MAGARSYHRDDLRGQLLRAGHALVAEHGHERLTVRALAQAADVSGAAPYHYFADRRALLLAVAEDGFRQLLEAAAPGPAVGGALDPDPRRRLRFLARAFIDFQERHPRLLELMYESELVRPAIDPSVARLQRQGFDLVTDAVRAALPAVPAAEARRRAVAYWSALYGFTSLSGKGMLAFFAAGCGDALADWREAVITQAVDAAAAPVATGERRS